MARAGNGKIFAIFGAKRGRGENNTFSWLGGATFLGCAKLGLGCAKLGFERCCGLMIEVVEWITATLACCRQQK